MSIIQPEFTPAGSAVAPNQRLARNPQLPQHPLGAFTDAQFEAELASLRADTAKKHADILRQLGYQDDQGNFIMGSVENEANRQRSDLDRSQRLAEEDVTHQAQREGTLFSGLRGTATARATHPFASAMADLDVSVPNTLSQLYESAGGLIDDYSIQQNRLLADAASRRAAAITAQGGAGGVPGGNDPALATPAFTPLPPPPPGTDVTGGGGGALVPPTGIYAGMGDLPAVDTGVAPPAAALPSASGIDVPTIAPTAAGVISPAEAASMMQPGAGLTIPNLAGPGQVQATGEVPTPGVLTAAQRKLMQWG